MPGTPFTFGVALMPRVAAHDWAVVEDLMRLCIGSLQAQTDPDFQVLVACHDRPRGLPDDPRIEYLQADWPAAPQDAANNDAGRKKHLLRRCVMAAGGGLFMFLDADDWADRRLVETARARLDAERPAAVIDRGFAVDPVNRRAAALPGPAFDGGFHRLCGSSTVALLRPAAADPLRRDPCAALGSHHRWVETAEDLGLPLLRLPVAGAYAVNTSENHSETHGPYARWRRNLSRQVARCGAPMDADFLARFGLRAAAVRSPLRPIALAPT